LGSDDGQSSVNGRLKDDVRYTKMVQKEGGDMKSFFNKKSGVFALAAGLGCLAGDLITEIFMKHDSELSGMLSAILSTGAWSIFICFGMALGVVIIQNKSLHKPLIVFSQIATLIGGSIIGGGIAGVAAQLFYSYTAAKISQELHGLVMRAIAWGLLGGIAAFSMTRHIANLSKKGALLGGFIGGVIGAFFFVFISSSFGGTPGRLIGTFLVGACVGAMVGIIEAAISEAWLIVIYAANERTTINLGQKPVTFGTGKGDTVFVRGTVESAFAFKLEKGTIFCTEHGQQRTIQPGEKVTLEKITIEVGAKQNAAPGSAQNTQQATPKPPTPTKTGSAATSAALYLSIKNYRLPLTDGQKLYACHTTDKNNDTKTITGEVITNKKDTNLMGIRNLTEDVWKFTGTNGQERRIVKNEVVPLKVGMNDFVINFNGITGKITRK
jgi:hypothetical protein